MNSDSLSVRGQLEPSDSPSNGTSWRYLQCSDVPNELRVLLPPRTAMIYDHLLRVEALELSKGKAASWDRLQEIHHLKERMIRKCRRLSRTSTTRDKNTSRLMYYTVHAPPDFRMKEMERWFRNQDPQSIQLDHVLPRTNSTCCSKCGPLLPLSQTLPRQPQPPPRRTHSTSQRTVNTKSNIAERIPRRSSASQLSSSRHPQPSASTHRHRRNESSPPPLPVPAPARHRTASRPLPQRQPSASKTQPPEPSKEPSPPRDLRLEHPPRATLQSPDPVPIPYRPRDTDRQVEVPLVDRSPSPIYDEGDDLYQQLSAPPYPSIDPPEFDQPPFPSGPPLETIHEFDYPTLASSRPNLPRRRSSLKKSGSMSRLSVISQAKSVSWAMDKDWVDQLARFAEVTDEAESAAKELADVRTEYQTHIYNMRGVCRSVVSAAEKIRLETEFIRKEEIALRDQEYRYLAALEQMEAKEAEYHTKVIAVLEETKRVVQLCEKKREH